MEFEIMFENICYIDLRYEKTDIFDLIDIQFTCNIDRLMLSRDRAGALTIYHRFIIPKMISFDQDFRRKSKRTNYFSKSSNVILFKTDKTDWRVNPSFAFDFYKQDELIDFLFRYQILTDQWTIIIRLNQLNHPKDLVCTRQGILKGIDENDGEWSYDLIKNWFYL